MRMSDWSSDVCSSDLKGLVIRAGKASTMRDLLKNEHAKAPPVARRRDAARNRFGRGVARDLERRHDIEVVVGEPRRTEPGYEEDQRIAGPPHDRPRPQVSGRGTASWRERSCTDGGN